MQLRQLSLAVFSKGYKKPSKIYHIKRMESIEGEVVNTVTLYAAKLIGNEVLLASTKLIGEPAIFNGEDMIEPPAIIKNDGAIYDESNEIMSMDEGEAIETVLGLL